MGGNCLEPITVDLHADGPGFIVAGPRRSGKSNALMVLARSLVLNGTKVIGIYSHSSPLQGIEGTEGVGAVLNGRSATVEELDAAMAWASGPHAVLVDDCDQLVDSPLGTALETMVRVARERHRAVVIAGGITELNAGSFRGLVAETKKSRAGLLLSPSSSGDADLLGVRLPKTSLFTGPPGRAVQVAGGSHRLIQVADAFDCGSSEAP
jgi:S-DNA-T family DNA segregation ATPase FtsK/SpoIIIE